MIVALVAALTGALATAQPSFEGRWGLETAGLAAPDVPRALVVRQTFARDNVRGEPTEPFVKALVVSREYDAGVRHETYHLGIIGGMVPGVDQSGRFAGFREHHAIGWDGGALVLRSGRYTGDAPETGDWDERRETWSIDAAGLLHVIVLTRSSTEPTRTRHLIYRRR